MIRLAAASGRNIIFLMIFLSPEKVENSILTSQPTKHPVNMLQFSFVPHSNAITSPQTKHRPVREHDGRCSSQQSQHYDNRVRIDRIDQGARRIEIVLSDERVGYSGASLSSNGASATSPPPHFNHKQSLPPQAQHFHYANDVNDVAPTSQTLPYYPQARKSIVSLSNASTVADFATSSNQRNANGNMSLERDRLGLMGAGDHDGEIPGTLGGLQRLTTTRYNKVSVRGCFLVRDNQRKCDAIPLRTDETLVFALLSVTIPWNLLRTRCVHELHIQIVTRKSDIQTVKHNTTQYSVSVSQSHTKSMTNSFRVLFCVMCYVLCVHTKPCRARNRSNRNTCEILSLHECCIEFVWSSKSDSFM